MRESRHPRSCSAAPSPVPTDLSSHRESRMLLSTVAAANRLRLDSCQALWCPGHLSAAAEQPVCPALSSWGCRPLATLYSFKPKVQSPQQCVSAHHPPAISLQALGLHTWLGTEAHNTCWLNDDDPSSATPSKRPEHPSEHQKEGTSALVSTITSVVTDCDRDPGGEAKRRVQAI